LMKIGMMRYILTVLSIALLASCNPKRQILKPFTTAEVQVIWEDSVSIRALEVIPGSIAFAGNSGVYGSYTLADSTLRAGRQEYLGTYPEFRAVAHTNTDFFMLSVGTPALLYKTGSLGKMELVYTEDGPEVFYDAMAFWDNRHGIAIGDSQSGCLAILITDDGGANWSKIPCEQLPPALAGEGAFAASNTNIAIVGNRCWIATSKGRIFYTEDFGGSWTVQNPPIASDTESQGIYSIHFSDALTGFAIGGDYTRPEVNYRNKARTLDGGITWEAVASGSDPGYKSCVQVVPETNGLGVVAVGFTGMSYSSDGGDSWVKLSDEPFYTIRFLNPKVAFAAGKGRLAKIDFR
jgi:photosystem II stability/assembly factor-like uncharacterized protein